MVLPAEADGTALFRCRASAHTSTDPEPSSVVTTTLITGFAILTAGLVLIYQHIGPPPTPCFLPLLLPGIPLLWRALRPDRRGRLILHRSRLVFERNRGPGVKIKLADVARIGRRRHCIHVTLRDQRVSHYFSCSRLHGEDMYDRILARLEESNAAIPSHERVR